MIGSETELPSGTVTFLFTDVEGSTRLWERDRSAMSVAMERHDRLLRGVIEDNGGYVFTTAGDSFSAAFQSTSHAIGAALGIDAALGLETWPTADPIRVRQGVHLGEAFERDGDYFGPTVNKTARIMSAAHGGQTLLSDAAHAQLEPGPTTVVMSLGDYRLKDLESAAALWQLGEGDHPPLRTLDIVRHNLPQQRTSLVGRAEDIADVSKLLDSHRLVTLLGIGGSGKTRLAAAVGADIAHRFPHGVWFVDLVAATDLGDVVESVVAATGVGVTGRDLLAAAVDALAKRDTLVILDNCEHVIDEAAELADRLLEAGGELHLLATSREPLQLPDERQVIVESLESLATADAPGVQLFCSTAERVGVDPGSLDLTLVASVVDRLDGHPLSIELAAPRLRELSLEELAGRLDERFELLTQRRRGRSRRQASLLAVLEDSWSQLEPTEQNMLLHLAAFPADFTASDAELLVAEAGVRSALHHLTGLADRGFIATNGDRLRLLETIKLFARERWQASADPGVFLERHTQWVLGQLRSYPPEARYVSYVMSDWVRDHREDCRATEDRLAAANRTAELSEYISHIQLAARLVPSGFSPALIDRIEHYLESMDLDSFERSRLSLTAASAALQARRPDWFVRGSDEVLDNVAEADDPLALANAMIISSWMTALSDLDRALELLADAQHLAESVGAPALANIAIGYAGSHLALAGRLDDAQRQLDVLDARLTAGARQDDVNLANAVRFMVYILDKPETAVEVTNDMRRNNADNWTFVMLAACAHASNASVSVTRGLVNDVQTLLEHEVDDGLPDLLLPPALLAFRLGRVDLAARWATAIRRAPMPTANFPTTSAYRQLRNRVELLSENPLADATIEKIFDEALAWLNDLPADELIDEAG